MNNSWEQISCNRLGLNDKAHELVKEEARKERENAGKKAGKKKSNNGVCIAFVGVVEGGTRATTKWLPTTAYVRLKLANLILSFFLGFLSLAPPNAVSFDHPVHVRRPG